MKNLKTPITKIATGLSIDISGTVIAKNKTAIIVSKEDGNLVQVKIVDKYLNTIDVDDKVSFDSTGVLTDHQREVKEIKKVEKTPVKSGCFSHKVNL